MTQKLAAAIGLDVVPCAHCGITFAMPTDFADQRRKDHRDFYCPNGHSLTYTGKTEAEKLSAQLEHTKADMEFERNLREATEQSNSALRGVITRQKRRLAAAKASGDEAAA